ncbi:MAG: hypothetical protein JWQ18_583 [Conexibacter sp.]|nr:hypothetical protein [Conexibacter sp.]
MALPSGDTGNHRRTATRGRKGQKRQNDLLAAAITLFSRNGFPSTTVQELADTAGIDKGGLYYYLESKDDLLFQILDRVHDEASAILDEAAHIDAPPLSRLHTYLERYITFFLENIDRMSLYVREWRHLDPPHRTRIVEQRRIYEDFAVELIREAQQRGEASKDIDARYATFFIVGAISSLAEWYDPHGQEPAGAIARRYADHALAILTPASPLPPA